MKTNIGDQEVTLRWQEWGPESSTLPPVICLHAVNRVGDDFTVLARRLSAQRRVICPDLPGRGASDWLEDPALYTHQTYLAVLDALLPALGLGAEAVFDLVGTSLGGLLGILYAARHPARVRRLVLNDVGTFTARDVFAQAARSISHPMRLRNVEQAILIFKVMTASCGPLSDAEWDLVSRPMVCPTGEGGYTLRYDPRIAEQLARDASEDLDLQDFYEQIPCPVLLIRGEKSDVVSEENALQMAHSGPRAEILTIPETGHFPMLVKAGETRAVEDFLAR
jgi:pimeloyl-ACP methyl ester carboxylesterase